MYWKACGRTDVCAPTVTVMSYVADVVGRREDDRVRRVERERGGDARAEVHLEPAAEAAAGDVDPVAAVLVALGGVTPVTTKLHDAVSATQMLAQQVPPVADVAAGPQLFGSLVVSTHEAPQSRCASGAHAGVAARVEGGVASRPRVERE